MEQAHSFNEQQGMMLLGLDKNSKDGVKRPRVPRSSQPALSTSDQHRHGDPRPPSQDKPSSSVQTNQSQLDEDLRLYMPLARSSNDHPALRFLSPGAPGDPRVFTTQALADLNTPYSDGSSAENRRLVGIRNSEQFSGRWE